MTVETGGVVTRARYRVMSEQTSSSGTTSTTKNSDTKAARLARTHLWVLELHKMIAAEREKMKTSTSLPQDTRPTDKAVSCATKRLTRSKKSRIGSLKDKQLSTVKRSSN